MNNLLENLKKMKVFGTKKKDTIEKFNAILEEDEIFSEIKETIDKLDSQMNDNLIAVEEIEETVEKLEKYKEEITKRTDSYREMTMKLKEFI